jgi:hypothetical protein
LPQADPAIRRWDEEWVVHHALSNHTFRLSAPAGALLAALGPAPRTVAELAAAIGAEPDEVDALLAELAVLAHDGSDQPHDVLLAPGRDWTPDAALVTALFRALRSSPYSRLVPVSALLGGDDEGTARDQLPANAVDPGELSAEDVRALADARDATTSFARAIGDSGALTAGLDERVLAPLSLAWRGDANGRDALVHQVIATAADTRSGLSLTGPSSLNVISATAPVRFVVHNSLAVPASVAVQVDPHKACLRPTRSDAVTAAPGTDTPVVVSLDAVANCDVAVDATLVGTDGATVGDAVGFPARVAPTIEDVGTIVVGALLALGLVLGIVRTVRRGQSARRGARQAPVEPARLPVLGGDPETAATDADPDDETGR